MMKFSFTFLLLLCVGLAFSQRESDVAQAHQFQLELNQSFSDTAKSPLTKADLLTFKNLDFFPVSASYIINAKFKRTKNEKPFEMATTTARKPMYVKYGELHFTIDGKELKLNVYQNIAFKTHPKYKDDLFLPFTDRTSGNETYGGGRYIDIKIPTSKSVVVDFNQAYNPYCAYNEKYSCPIVPAENDLDVEIRAGVRKFHE